MDAAVAAAVPSVQRVAPDQVMSLASETAALASPLRAEIVYAEPSMAGAGDYLALLKPRVMSLVVFTALAGLVVAPGHFHPVLAFFSLVCIAVGAGAAGALNMWYDADIDAVMSRTSERPIPAGRVQPGEALAFGLVLAGFSVVFLGLMINLLAARRQILLYSLVLAPVGMSPWLLGYAGLIYGAVASLGGALMVALALHLYGTQEDAAEPVAKRLFGISIVYLFALFAVLLVERALGLQHFGLPFGRV